MKHDVQSVLKPRWRHGTYVLDNTIVGVVDTDSFGRTLWWAYGCDVEWADVRLGSYGTEHKAQRAVEAWVRERL